MEFNLSKIKGFATTAFSRAVQYTEEKLGTSDKTELDAAYEELAEKCDKTKLYTEKIVNRTMCVLEPNPNFQMADFVLEKLDKKQDRLRNIELLGNDMIETGLEFGSHTIYGSALITVGKTQQQLGKLEKQFVENSVVRFVRPLTKFLNEDVRTIMDERKILLAKRLDLDSAKNRIKKAKSLESQNNLKLKTEAIAKEIDLAEQDLKTAEEKFNKQVEITKLLLEGISSAQTNHVRCLSEFVNLQIQYYTECHQQMIELQFQLSQLNQPNNLVNNQISNGTSLNGKSTTLSNQINGKLVRNQPKNNQIFKISNSLISPTDELPTNLPDHKKRARVLYNYTPQGNGELSLTMNEIIIVNLNDTDDISIDSDFLSAERGLEKGKVPISYLEIMN